MAAPGDVDDIGASRQRGQRRRVQQAGGLGGQRQGIDDDVADRQQRLQGAAAAAPAGDLQAQGGEHAADLAAHLAKAQHRHPVARRCHRPALPQALLLLGVVGGQAPGVAQHHRRHVLGNAQGLVGVDHARYLHGRGQVGHQQLFHPGGNRADPAQRRQARGQPGRKAPAQHHLGGCQRGIVQRAAVGLYTQAGGLAPQRVHQGRGQRGVYQQQDRGGRAHAASVARRRQCRYHRCDAGAARRTEAGQKADRRRTDGRKSGKSNHGPAAAGAKLPVGGWAARRGPAAPVGAGAQACAIVMRGDDC